MAIKNKTQLVLKDKDGKKVVHEKNHLTAGDVLDALECQERMYAENTTAVKQFNELVEFNISLFNSDEVTRESILQGLTNDEAFSALNQPILDILGIDPSSEENEKK
ncbi:hypothetical protein FAE19_RS04885 [Enterococcus hirae]|uniref:phage tail assembly chaperone G n=1 Tax=Enterococcus hirae TaxID=1354 RepID=UPI0015F2722A|nr:hypothetical protein [Enterococcus hirae]EMF0039449.1 hypothetical protein [Enterococcus hirae]EMF0065791.1 hypothetical protein [Enterococcus hirae]EMF0078938.1 hypothetical protein [Enterococcus hirae]EMF0097094.1 hypothetical protein [Enterococcus hirae]EMF0128579.1 hypothetical protein [Enterococcus hirae]